MQHSGGKAEDRAAGAAYAHCLSLARAHYENFPTASTLLLGKSLAGPVAAIYAFARTADDYADEPGEGTPEERLAKLETWGEELRRAYEGRSSHPVFVALSDTARRYKLPIGLFEALLSAFRQDVVKSRYATAAEMLDYCTRSADPVGRLVLRLHGYGDPKLDALSDAVCTGLQLVNFWQDVAIDLKMDRIYLPQSEMKKYGVTEAALRQERPPESLVPLLRQECARAREILARGRPLPAAVRGRLALWLRCVWLGGNRILDKIEAAGFDVFGRRPVLSAWDKFAIFARALSAWVFERPRLSAAGSAAANGARP